MHLEKPSIASLKGTRNLTQLEHVIVRDSHRYVVLSTIASIRDAAARPLYLFLQVQDLSEQRRTMEALMASEQQFRLLVDAVVDYALFMLDPHGVITSWNPGAERIKGYAASEIIGQHFRVFYTADAQRARHPEKELDEAIATGRYEEEGWRVRKDGSQFWANVIITPIRREGALVGFAKVTRDFTARRLAQMDQEVSARRIAESNEALTVAGHELADVLSMTAHEMRGPVALIRGYAEMLIHDQAGGDPVVNSPVAVKAISAQGERLAHLIDDLLTAARLDGSQMPMNLENVDVRDVVLSVIAGLDPSDAATVKVRGHGLVARGDRLRLTQILSNYISNAQRHGRPPIVIDLTVADDAVKICVRDAGPGVSPDLRPRLFREILAVPRDVNSWGYWARSLYRSRLGPSTRWRRMVRGRQRIALLRRQPAAHLERCCTSGPRAIRGRLSHTLTALSRDRPGRSVRANRGYGPPTR